MKRQVLMKVTSGKKFFNPDFLLSKVVFCMSIKHMTTPTTKFE